LLNGVGVFDHPCRAPRVREMMSARCRPAVLLFLNQVDHPHVD
jgi:hypothetical protein